MVTKNAPTKKSGSTTRRAVSKEVKPVVKEVKPVMKEITVSEAQKLLSTKGFQRLIAVRVDAANKNKIIELTLRE